MRNNKPCECVVDDTAATTNFTSISKEMTEL